MECVQAFDADERVFVVFAHDVELFGIVEFFPEIADAWREKVWKERARWGFVKGMLEIARGEESGGGDEG